MTSPAPIGSLGVQSLVTSVLFRVLNKNALILILKEMATLYLFIYLAFILFWAIMVSPAYTITDELDVAAIQDLYKALGNPQQLQGWKSNGGDPCGESWIGITCFESSVIYINLHRFNPTGYLGRQLFNLHNLKQLDVSSNYIQGEIPYNLPPNVTHIDRNLACNNLTKNIPGTLPSLINLRHQLTTRLADDIILLAIHSGISSAKQQSMKHWFTFHFLFVAILLRPAVADLNLDKQALLDFSAAVPHGRKLNWNTSASICASWVGIKCNTDRTRVVSVRLPVVKYVQ